MRKEDNTTNSMIAFLSQISDANRRIVEQINLDAIEQAVNASNAVIDNLSNLESVFESISNTLKMHYEQINAIASMSSKLISDMIDLQASVAVAASLYDSTMIDTVAKCVAALNLDGCIASIQTAVDKPTIIMPDYSFMKTSPLMRSVKNSIRLPYGFATDIKNFNCSSAKQIADNKSIIFNSQERAFIADGQSITVSEINTICTTVRFFEIIGESELFTENELIDFMSFLDQTPKLALNNPIGQRINQIILNINDFIGFDREYFYHSRPRKKTEPPFVWGQMLKAPYGVSSMGRFNDAGQARFYFADTEKGAVEEIRKHIKSSVGKDYTIQTVKIAAHNPIKILDLSAKEMRGLNNFLKYIRMPYTNASGNRPREYLIPQFVADCCYSRGIDGIKYYGGKDYSNYVTWKDGYFNYIKNLGDSEI